MIKKGEKMLNQSIVTGRLTKDADLKMVQERAVVSFTLASSRDYKDDEDHYPADFIDCVLWGKAAEHLVSLTAKGDTLQVTGRLQTRTYKDKKEVTHKVTELQVDKWYLVSVSQTQGEYPVKEKTIVKDSDNLEKLSL